MPQRVMLASLSLLLGGVLPAVAVSTHAVEVQDEETGRDLSSVAVRLEDLGPDFRVDEARSRGLRVEGRRATYEVAYAKSPAGMILGSGPFYVGNLLAAPGEPIPDGILDVIATALLDLEISSGSFAVPGGLMPVPGPPIGEESRWAQGSGVAEDLPITMYILAFQAADTVVILGAAGFPDRTSQEDVGALGRLVAARLGWPGPMVPPDAVTSPTPAPATPAPVGPTAAPPTPLAASPTPTSAPIRPSSTPTPRG